MKTMHGKSLTLAVISALCFSVTACAAGDPFVGDWTLDPARSKLTDVMKVERLGGNKYTFNFGGGPQAIVVDGTDQPGGFGTTLSVAADRPETWKVVRKKDGRLLLVAVWNLSADGRTPTDHYSLHMTPSAISRRAEIGRLR